MCLISGISSLVAAIDTTKTILADLRSFNKREWVVRYPQAQEESQNPSPNPSPIDSNSETHIIQPGALQGDNSSADVQPAQNSQEQSKPAKSIPDHVAPRPEFHVLRLDLKLGPHGSSTSASSPYPSSKNLL